MEHAFQMLNQVVEERKKNPQEGSYTCYLFEKGMDKILKKIGEECAETIIAAKNGDKEEIKEEMCDLIYHLFVMMQEAGVTLEDIEATLIQRSRKIGNLKEMKVTDLNS